MGLSLVSAPPQKHASAALRWITRSDSPRLSAPDASAQVIVFDGPWASWMIVTWHASMLGRYFSSHSGVRCSMPDSPH